MLFVGYEKIVNNRHKNRARIQPKKVGNHLGNLENINILMYNKTTVEGKTYFRPTPIFSGAVTGHGEQAHTADDGMRSLK